MIEYKDLKWEGNSLFYGKKDTTVRLVIDENFHSHYWVEWDFGTPMRSIRAYNISNAKDNGKVLYMRYRNNSAEKRPQEAQGFV